MGSLQPRQLARLGISFLEEAILGVLFEAKKKGEEIDLSEMSKKLDLPVRRHTYGSNRNDIVRTILDRLESEGRVEPCSGDSKKWQLTAQEFKDW